MLLMIVQLSLFNVTELHAIPSYLWGVSVSYQYAALNQYLVHVRLYRDCSGIPAPDSLTLCLSSSSIAYSDTFHVVKNPGSYFLPPCPYIPPALSSCQGGTAFGLERVEYSASLTLTAVSHDWIISYNNPYLPSGPGFPFDDYSYRVSTRIDNLNYAVNSAPAFIYDPVFDYCVLQPAWNNLFANDSDGDSLVYSLVPTLLDTMFCPPGVPFSNVWFSPPVSAVPIYCDQDSGWIYFDPQIVQIAQLTLMIQEYRSGVLFNESVSTQNVNIISGCTLTEIENDPYKPLISVYPIPAKSFIHIRNSISGGIGDALVFEVSGKQVLQVPFAAEDGGITLNVETLPSGIYFLKLLTESEETMLRFIKE